MRTKNFVSRPVMFFAFFFSMTALCIFCCHPLGEGSLKREPMETTGAKMKNKNHIISVPSGLTLTRQVRAAVHSGYRQRTRRLIPWIC